MSIQKVRRYKTILARLRNELNENAPNSVQLNEPLSKYVLGGAAAEIGFLQTLNNAPGFSQDGLVLMPGDLHEPANVRHVLIAILEFYMQNGWTIT